ncbi:MAG: SET domain-containing protein-lysine N-methyltransferase [Microthrixaceae bacterium]
MTVGWLTPQAEVRGVPHKGQGVFAVTRILAGQTVAAFGGHIVTSDQLQELPRWQQERSLQLDHQLFLTTTERNDPADFINHSCQANCGFLGSNLLRAMVEIQVGEELSFDYAMSDSAPYDEFECHCGASICRGDVQADAWKSPELQQQYNGFFSAYLQDQIGNEQNSL